MESIFSSNYRNKRLQCYDWWQIVFDQPGNNSKKYDSIQKNASGHGDDYATGCLWDLNYFKEY